ncbi:MAG: cytosine deaminase [Chloroflexi bacterium]|nr:MAG: cytosine deaminase [Chloroflexota bacterium]MBL1197189.1 cytosine deaminase [Chloroflexota bacterium]NOH14483.1 amidohydrolase family protein [Chloroflexota bacterium]
MSALDLVIRNAKLDTTGEAVEVGIKDGIIAAVSPTGLPPAAQEIDAAGCMVSPAFVEPHFHLENALLWEGVRNNSGTLKEAIEVYGKIKHEMPIDDIVSRASVALETSIMHGVQWFRSHIDIDKKAQLHLLEGNLAVREKFKDLIDIELIAFPQMGMATESEIIDLMWQAMEKGADVVGGMPHAEENMDDAARQIEIAFEIAKKHDADIDMHVDETDDPYWHSLELLADQTIENGWEGRVTAGHCCAMSAWDDALAERVIEKVVKARINVITMAPVNLMLEGRSDKHPKRRGIARVKELMEAGANVTCGQDDLQNMFYSYGNMDPLEVAMISAHAAHMSSPEEIQAAFDMPRYNAAKNFRLENYGVHVGAEANLVVLDAISAVDALRRRGDRRYVLRKGRVLTETRTRVDLHFTTDEQQTNGMK